MRTFGGVVQFGWPISGLGRDLGLEEFGRFFALIFSIEEVMHRVTG